MGRKRLEPARIRSLKLPVRLWNLLKKASDNSDQTVNNLMWRMIEDWLCENGYLKDEDRKRESLRD